MRRCPARRTSNADDVAACSHRAACASRVAQAVLEVFNVLVLVIFSVGIVVSFMLPFHEPLWKGGTLVKDHKRIAYAYLTSWFLFDLM